MNITKTEVRLTSSDFMSMIEDYVKITNLHIAKITIDKFIKIEGKYKFGATINFSVELSMQSYSSEAITFKIEKIKVVKLGIFDWIKKLALNKLVKKLNISGLNGNGDILQVNILKILELLPIYLKFDLVTCEIEENCIVVAAENIVFNMSKPIMGQEAVKKIEDKKPRFSEIKKVKDNYTKVREKFENKIPDKFDTLIEYAFLLPDIMALFYRIFKDKRVPVKTKIIVGGVIGYLAVPIDILPDFLPFIGKIDDLALAFYALDKVINHISPDIIIENWEGDFKSILKIQQGLNYIYKVAGGEKVDKLVKLAEKVYKLSNEDTISDETPYMVKEII